MSWFGVSLNDIKGQLTSFTNEVLSEGLEGVEDGSQVIVSRDRIQELESLCQLQKHELEEAKRAREELEERLQASNLHGAHQVSALRQQLQQKEDELRQLREKSVEWGWGAGEGDGGGEGGGGDGGGVPGSLKHQRKPPAPSPPSPGREQQQPPERQLAWQEHLNQQLSRRVEELERELVRLREAHQEEVSALQDHHRQHLLSLTPGRPDLGEGETGGGGGGGGDDDGAVETTTSVKSEDGAAARSTGQDTAAVAQRFRELEHERDELQAALGALQIQLQDLRPKAEAAADLESQLVSMNEKYAALQKQNEQNEESLEELDNQHQEAVEQILKKRNKLQEEAQVLRAAQQEVSEALAQALEEQQKSRQEINTLQAEAAALRLSEEAAQSTLKQQLEAHSQELNDLKGQLHEKTTSVLKLEENVQALSQENARLSQLEEELSAHQEKERLHWSTLEKNNLVLEELKSIRARYEGEKKSNAELRTSLENMKSEIQKLVLSEGSLRESHEQSEERRRAAEIKADHLEQQIHDLTQEVTSLTQTVSEAQTFQESSKEKDSLQEKISMTEAAKCLTEQELQKCQQSLEDTKARTEILESQLQAKAQELTMSNTTIAKLEVRVKQAESDLTVADRSQTDEMEELKKALAHHNEEVPKTVKAGIHKLVELLRDSVWQRDTLERHVSTLTQELREKNDLLGEAELSRAELERECEDLRDQLEEVQKGVRPQPEGSSRGLPTIEEEAEGGVEGDVEGDQVKEGCGVKEDHQREPSMPDRSHEIEALRAQVEALSEARRNLETEAANMRAERERLHSQLQQVEGRSGNLANLETEAATLRNEKKNLEMQLESLAQELDLTTVTLQDERDTLREQLNTQGEQLQSIQVELSILKHERNSIGQQLVSQYKVMEERDATIRMLESEIDGLKDTLRETFSDQSKSRETSLQEELNSVKSQLIYKEDKVDALSQVLQQIGEYFEVEDASTNIDKARKIVQEKYSTLETTLKEKEGRVEEMSKKISILQSELETYKVKLDNEATSATKLSETDKELSLTKEHLKRVEMEALQLQDKIEEKHRLISAMENSAQAMQGEIETLKLKQNEDMCLLEERNKELMNLRGELDKFQKATAEKEELICTLTKDLAEARTKITKEEKAVEDLSQDIAGKNQEIAEKVAKVKNLEEEVTEMKAREKAQASQLPDTGTIIQQVHALREEKTHLLEEKNSLLQEKERLRLEAEEHRTGREVAMRELETLRGEREQMIATITHKHQESVSYHSEIQRLSHVLTQTSQQHTEQKAALSAQLSESEAALAESRNHVTSLREELHSLRKSQNELQKSAAEGIIKKTELDGLRKELESLRAKFSVVEQERDQLRVANAHFNTQYQDQSKELNNVKERESRLACECERLRQHLVTVEESYTAEALKGEEREATLRSTLAKMEEKLNSHSSLFNSASQRASVQVEALQEQLQEISAKRDDAVLRLHTAEEVTEQHQHSLATLQQVLQDFQKNQAREIAEATERTRRKLEEEQEKNISLTTQVNTLKSQLAEAQGGLAAASRLGDQLAKKEQMIVALKAQVSSQEEVARRARDEVSCLKNSSEGKVDKPLLRNLLVGYFATPLDKRQEVLRIIAEVLDFSGEERARTGLDTQGTSWLSSIANFLAPPASNVRVTSKVDVLDHTSLSQAFIRFLEDESSPRPQPRLPAVQMAQQTTEKAEKKAQAKAQATSKINPFISSGDTQVPGSDRSSRNSSPLLAAASTPPTLPSLAPQQHPVSSPLSTPTPITPGVGGSVQTGANTVSTNKYLTSLLTSDTVKSDENANKQLT